LRQSSDKLIYCKISAKLIKQGTRLIINGIIHDISKQKQLEDALRLADISKEAALAKNEFIASLSHELRTPLNAIIGVSNLLSKTKIDSNQMEYIDIIQHSTESLLVLIDEVLDYSKIEAGKMELDNNVFDIREVLDTVIDMLSLKAAEKNIELSCLVTHNIPTLVMGDGIRLRQILLNLLSNAIKYTNQGEVQINVSLVADTGSSYRIRFDIIDTGIGIPSNRYKDIFDSFERLKSSGSHRIEGTGLGLAIAKRLTNMMGGEIDCISIEGKGSKFWVLLNFNKLQNHSSDMKQDSFLFLRKRILIVNPIEKENIILSEHLKYWGSRYHICSNGHDAINKLRAASHDEDCYDVIILNYEIPNMSCQEIVSSIKNIKGLEQTKIIHLVPFSHQHNIHFDNSLFAAAITKPIRISHLKHSIELAFKQISTDIPEPTKTFTGLFKEFSASRPNILLVEDNPVNLEVMKKILYQMGLEVHLAINGKEAVSKFKANKYDLVFMDIQMPEMDGIEATKRIRHMPKGKKIPIIAMSAYVMNRERDKAFKAGMNDYITKPVNFKELESVISLYLSGLFRFNDSNPGPTKSTDSSEMTNSIFNYTDLMRRLSVDKSFDDPSFISDLLLLFINTTTEKIEKMEIAVDKRNTPEIIRIGHFLKGSAKNICAIDLSKLAESIENAGHRNDWNIIYKLVINFIQEFQVFKMETMEYISKK
ncbi:MAG: response regulator, partial [Candidatus Margulisbacteria bacterium]|nr:response regulator [Candidatus Margulisiibacteriota bacterium]